MSTSLQDASVVVIGGTSGIGLALAQRARAEGAQVTIAGRDQARLDAALAELGGDARGFSLDVADDAAVAELFAAHDHVDHVAVLAGTHVHGNLADVADELLAGPVDNRFWGPVHVFKHAPPKMTRGSITLCTGVGVERPRAGAAIVAAACGGVEVLARAMAIELKPLRVNVVRPGIVDTPLLDRMSGGNRDAVLEGYAKRVPVGRAAQPEEIADAIAFLMTNEYMDGATLSIDGGVGLA